MAEKKEQLRLTKSRWKLLREHIGRNIINSFQKIYQRNEAVERKSQMSEELQIEEILEEANAYNLRKEVKDHANLILQNDDILISRIDAYLMAYQEIVNE